MNNHSFSRHKIWQAIHLELEGIFLLVELDHSELGKASSSFESHLIPKQ